MTCFSIPYRRVRVVLIRQLQLNNAGLRSNVSYRANLQKVDKLNWMNNKKQKTFTEPLGLISLFFPMSCFGLAIWQYNRKKWKEVLIHDMKMRTMIPAVQIPENLSDRLKMEYKKVKTRGTFIHSKEMYIGPRSLIIDGAFVETEPFIFNFGPPKKPSIGFMVVTPFKLADRDETILVNRGWVPMDKKDPSTRLEGQIEGEIEIEGIIRLKEDKPSFLHKGADPREFRYRDLLSMAEFASTSHFYIDAVKESSVPGGPIGGQTQVSLKNDHLQYIVTWIILGVYTLNMWHKRWVRNLK